MLGVLTIIEDVPLVYILLPGYLIACALTLVASEDYVCVAWDRYVLQGRARILLLAETFRSAGVTTGPVTGTLTMRFVLLTSAPAGRALTSNQFRLF